MNSDRKTSGRELLLTALAHKTIPSVPWLPFAGVHAGKLTGIEATPLLTDADALVQALRQVNALYDPVG